MRRELVCVSSGLTRGRQSQRFFQLILRSGKPRGRGIGALEIMNILARLLATLERVLQGNSVQTSTQDIESSRQNSPPNELDIDAIEDSVERPSAVGGASEREVPDTLRVKAKGAGTNT